MKEWSNAEGKLAKNFRQSKNNLWYHLPRKFMWWLLYNRKIHEVMTTIPIFKLLPNQLKKEQIYSAGHSLFLAYPSSTGPHSSLPSTGHVQHHLQGSCICAIKAISVIPSFITNNSTSGKGFTRLRKPTKDAWHINIDCFHILLHGHYISIIQNK